MWLTAMQLPESTTGMSWPQHDVAALEDQQAPSKLAPAQTSITFEAARWPPDVATSCRGGDNTAVVNCTGYANVGDACMPQCM